MTIDVQAVPVVPLNVRLRRHRGTALVIGYEHALELSDTALEVWGRIDGERTVGEIAQHLVDTYGISTETAVEDVDALLQELAQHQLVRVSTP